jgi:hypothetical protein
MCNCGMSAAALYAVSRYEQTCAGQYMSVAQCMALVLGCGLRVGRCLSVDMWG